jgi:hypothetical protein
MRSPTTSADLVLTLWTDDPALARRADAAGVDRIGVDLERLGKAERQGGRGTWISPHRPEALLRLVPELKRASPFARIDPPNPGTRRQVEEVIDHGARVVMLPMVSEPEEAEQFVEAVAGRADSVLLIECADAVENAAALAGVEGVDELHLGLNDLALSLGLASRWQVLGLDLAMGVGAAAEAAGKRFGLGGVGRPGDRDLPIPADLVYAEIARTGASATLISRSFLSGVDRDLAALVRDARTAVARWRLQPPEALEEAHAELARRASRVAEWGP